MNRNTRHDRRGAIGIVMIVVLVAVQLMVIAVVLGGTRDQDLSIQRVDSARSFYAAEAGLNMAIREVMVAEDEDGDGTAGSISNDGNDANDPVLISARVAVNINATTTPAKLTSLARAGLARRSADVDITATGGGSVQAVQVAFSRSGSNQPRFCQWTGSGWTASAAMPNVGGVGKWVAMKICPTRNETAFVVEDEGDDVNILFFNGTSWSSTHEVSDDTAGTNDRPEDVAYEQVSGDALAVYWRDTVKRFGYRTYNGTSFSGDNALSSPFATEADYLTLYPRPGSDEIMMLTADGQDGGPLKANLWNGSSWGSWTTLVSSLETNNDECYAMAFECNSRDGLAVYADRGQSQPRYRTWTGSWSGQGSLPTVGAVPQWIRLAPDPTSNTIIMVSLDDASDINVNVWNGSAWGSNLELETSAVASDRRCFDIVFERGTGRALLVYGKSGQTRPRYRTWNGASWSAEQNGPDLGAVPQFVQLARGGDGGEVFVAVSDANKDLHLFRWDGSSMSAKTTVETNLGGETHQQSFGLPEPTVTPQPRVVAWVEVAP